MEPMEPPLDPPLNLLENTVIRKIFDGKMFSDGHGDPKFIYLKILQYEYLGYD